MFEDNQINELMKSAVEKMKNIIDVNTVFGTPFETKDGALFIPITKVSVGFVTGGGEYGCDKNTMKNIEKLPLAGGLGGGVSINPIGFLTIKNNEFKLIRIDEKNAYEKILDKIPDILDSIVPMVNKGDENDKIQ